MERPVYHGGGGWQRIKSKTFPKFVRKQPERPAHQKRESRSATNGTFRARVWHFLEAGNSAGLLFEYFTIFLIGLNVVSFIASTEEDLNKDCISFFGDDWLGVNDGLCDVFDAVEQITVLIFSVEYALRLWSCVEDDDAPSRCTFMCSFYSIVDLLSILPFFIDMALVNYDLPAAQFLRIMRLFRMMRVEGRYIDAFTVFDDIFQDNTGLLRTSGFVGATTWIILSSLYYLVEKDNPAMRLDPADPDSNRFRSILSSSYFTLVNLFGEYPLSSSHSPLGKVIGVVIAIFSVSVFSILTGIFGSGFQEYAEHKQEEKVARRGRLEFEKKKKEIWAMLEGPEKDSAISHLLSKEVEMTDGEEEIRNLQVELGELRDDLEEDSTLLRIHAFLHSQTQAGEIFESAILSLIAGNVMICILGTLEAVQKSESATRFLNIFDYVSVLIFSLEYMARLYAAGAEKRYSGILGRLRFACTFYAMVDLVSCLPSYIEISSSKDSASGTFVRALRLLRVLKADQYVQVLTVFDDIIASNVDILTVTGFAAGVMWIFFSSLLYYTERPINT